MNGIERIRALSSDIKDKPLLKIINYLLSRDDMNDKYLNDKKSIKGMIEFIRNEAQKEAHNGMAMLEDETVYGLAIHYFDETNENLGIKEDCKPDLNDDDDENEKADVNNQPSLSRSVQPLKSISEGQLTLF